MNVQKLADMMQIAVGDKQEHLKQLKETLREEGFKECGMAVSIMMDEMSDLGMDEECVLYWKTLGMTSLPYSPTEVDNE
jgi:predicted metal-dependent hydrolase